MLLPALLLLLLTTFVLISTAQQITLDVKSYVAPELDSIAFTFTLSKGQFTSSGRIRLTTVDSNGFTTEFVPATTASVCSLETDAETGVPYLHIPPPSGSPSTTFEQSCLGEFIAKSAFRVNAVYEGGDAPVSTTFTVARLQSLFAPVSNNPIFTPILQSPHFEDFSVGLPYTQGRLDFDIVLDHEFQPLFPTPTPPTPASSLPLTKPRNYFLHIQNAPRLSECTYTVKSAPVTPLPNLPRVTTVTLNSATPTDLHSTFTAVLTLPHTPFFTHPLDEQYNAQNVTDIFAYPSGSKSYQNGDFTAILAFSCLAQLPRESAMKDPTKLQYVLQLSTSADVDPITAKYSYLTVPITQPAIALPPSAVLQSPVAKLIVTPQLDDTCRIFSSSSPPSCQLTIQVTLDKDELAKDGGAVLLEVNAADELTFEMSSNYIQTLGDCTDTQATLAENIFKFVFTKSFIIDVSEGSQDETFTIICDAVTLTGSHPPFLTSPTQSQPGSAALARPIIQPDASQIRKTYAMTSTALQHFLDPPETQQTLTVTVAALRPTYTQAQNSFMSDAPHIAALVLDWMRSTLAFQVADHDALQLTNVEFTFQADSASKLAISVAYIGTLPNIQRFLPLFNSGTVGVDTPASAAIKSRIEQLYIDNAANADVSATASFFPISCRNGIKDYTETAIDCGGGVSDPTASHGPRCATGQACLFDSDCEMYCSSTITFLEQLTRPDLIHPAMQVVRKRIYQQGICFRNEAMSLGRLSLPLIALLVLFALLF